MSSVFSAIRPARLSACGVVFLLAVCAAFPALAQTAGKFLVTVGDVKLVGKDGKPREAQRGGELLEGDTIVTGANSLAQIRLQDNGLLSVRPNTEMKLDKFSFAGADDRKATLLISLVQGGLRSITGLIGKAHREGYKISTATATIGIRGTDHEPFFIPPGQSALGPPGTYDKVNSGMTFVQGRQGNPIDVSINQVAFVPLTGAQPVILPSVPSFFKQDLSVPDPQSRKAPAGEAPTTDTATTKSTDTRTLSTDSKVLTTTTTLKSGALSTTTLTPLDTKTTTTTVLTTPLTTTVSPTTSTLSTAVIQPTTSTLSTAVIQPTTSTLSTTVQPTTSTLSTTVVQPVTSTLSTVVQPVTSTLTTAPTTTLQTTTPSLLTTTPLLK